MSVPPADASSSRWRRFKNWSDSQWVAIRPGPEARRGAAWGTQTAAAITVIIGGLYGATVTSPVSRFASIPPPFKEKFTKPAMIEDEGYNQDWEVVFQTVRAPLSAFQPAGNSKVFDPSKLRSVRLKFDRTPMYKICVKP